MLKVSPEAKSILKTKKKNGYYKLIEWSKTRTEGIRKENEEIRKNYESQIKKISDRELAILGSALYWGEGYKNFNSAKRPIPYPYVCFGNSDPQMMLVFMKFLERILKIPKERMKMQVMIYPNLNPHESIEYWQGITKIPLKNFRYQVALSRASRGKRPKHLLPYGTLQLRVVKRQEFFKIKGLIDGIIKSLV